MESDKTEMMQQYFDESKKLKDDYGENSVVFMQNGKFYEIYGEKENCTTSLHEIAKVCDFKLGNKTEKYWQAGSPTYVLDKYVNKLQNANYTVAVYVQDGNKMERVLENIYSPGTFFPHDQSDIITNSISCVWVFTTKENYIIGMSNIDVITGKSVLYEYTESKISPTYDETERFVSIHNPNEIIFIHSENNCFINNLVKFSNSLNRNKFIIDLNDTENNQTVRASKCEKQVYQYEIFKKYFKNIQSLSFNYTIAITSMTFLLDWVWRHNPNLVSNIQPPVFENNSENMRLANHSLQQLNIINDSNVNNSTTSCIVNLINKCETSMGKRLTYTNIVHPQVSSESIINTYDIVEYIIESSEFIQNTRKEMKNIKDLEKFIRKIALSTITPLDMYYLHEDLKTIMTLYETIINDDTLNTYFKKVNTIDMETIQTNIMNLLENIEEVFDIQLCFEEGSLYTTEKNLIKKGYSETHDDIVIIYENTDKDLNMIKNTLSDLIKKLTLKNNKRNDDDFVDISKKEKGGYRLIATKKRATVLYDNKDKESLLSSPIFLQSLKKNFTITDIQCIPDIKDKLNICNTQITRICSNMTTSHTNMINSQKEIFNDFIENVLKEYSDVLLNFSNFVGHLDYILNIAHISKKYNFCKPKIVNIDNNNKSFVNIEKLRHPLIEQLLTDELYVPNDVKFDEKNKGLLLFGTNAVGKSSFIKALGISIIMAQAGFFAPASKFEYFPFKQIFTRIIGNDNIFKGLSTFAVEMLEFKNIIENVCENSIVLGDELCSGTETDSAISIVVAGINTLYDKKCSYVFATHFHEIVELDEITSKENLSIKHMSVIYDRSKGRLIYNRTLQDGHGDSMYGLEVCKSLNLPSDFLLNAHEIRNKYNTKGKSILDYIPCEYNAKKLKGGICDICHIDIATDVHHLQYQEDADSNGYITTNEVFHKNHVANLINICEKCHKEIHKSHKKMCVKKTTDGYSIVEIRETNNTQPESTIKKIRKKRVTKQVVSEQVAH
tara:strand:- start:1535 stop:4558 length:3024 start_codon:yes stop_codon:yes gene_type:complete